MRYIQRQRHSDISRYPTIKHKPFCIYGYTDILRILCAVYATGIYLPLVLWTSLSLFLCVLEHIQHIRERVSILRCMCTIPPSRRRYGFFGSCAGFFLLGERVPFRSLLYELSYRIVCLGLKMYMRGRQRLFQPVYPFPASLVRGFLWSELVGFCIPCLAGEMGMVRSPGIDIDVAGARSPL